MWSNGLKKLQTSIKNLNGVTLYDTVLHYCTVCYGVLRRFCITKTLNPSLGPDPNPKLPRQPSTLVLVLTLTLSYQGDPTNKEQKPKGQSYLHEDSLFFSSNGHSRSTLILWRHFSFRNSHTRSIFGSRSVVLVRSQKKSPVELTSMNLDSRRIISKWQLLYKILLLL